VLKETFFSRKNALIITFKGGLQVYEQIGSGVFWYRTLSKLFKIIGDERIIRIFV
jgi:hypothetical protein